MKGHVNNTLPELQAFKRAPSLGLSEWGNGNFKAIRADDVAVLYTDFQGTTMDTSEKTIDVRHNAIEVLRRQPDGCWKLIVGDPNGRG
jgi:hypothetical protein